MSVDKGGTGGPKGWNGGPEGWNGGPERVERRTKGVKRRTRTGGTADQNGGWTSGPERVERRTSTQRGNFDVFGGVALRQDSELISACKRDFFLGTFSAKNGILLAARAAIERHLKRFSRFGGK